MTALVPRPPATTRADLEARHRAKAAAIVGGLSWGAQLKFDTAYAVARWCDSRDIDPVTEMDVLGGKPLVNARWWLRKIGELGEAVEYVREDVISADPRLEALAKSDMVDVASRAQAEIVRRQFERIRYGAPEEAAAICVVHIKIRSMEEVSGMQFAGGGTGRKIGSGGAVRKGSEADPIGETFAIESALTRAYGKAGRVLAGFFPKLGAQVRAADDDEGLAHQVAEDKRAALPDGTPSVAQTPVRVLGAGAYDEPARREAEAVEMAQPRAAQPAVGFIGPPMTPEEQAAADLALDRRIEQLEQQDGGA